jgi:hypothetical protein
MDIAPLQLHSCMLAELNEPQGSKENKRPFTL